MLKKYSFVMMLVMLVAVGVAIGQTPVTEQPDHSRILPVNTGPQTIELMTPKVDEIWTENSTQIISWTATPVLPVDSVCLVLNGKDIKKPIVLAHFAKKNPLKWVWKKVSPMVDNATLEVQLYHGKTIVKDIHSFKIASAVAVKPAIYVLSPNGAEKLVVGAVQTISWKLGNMSVPSEKLVYTIQISRNDGKDWEVIAKDISNLPAYEYTWKVSPPSSPTCKIKVSCTDVNSSFLIEDISDADFAVNE